MMEKTLILKAGGVVVGRKKSLTALAEVIAAYRKAGDRVVLVVSAPDKATDLLKAVAKAVGTDALESALHAVEKRYAAWLDELGGHGAEQFFSLEFYALREAAFAATTCTLEVMDAIMAFGEKLSVKVVAAFLEAHGTPAMSYDASSGGMITTDAFGNADPTPEARRLLRSDLELILLREQVAVVTGFVGRTSQGQVTTLGRGGSDYSATFIAEVLRASRVEIWKETSLCATDPRLVPGTPLVSRLTYEQAGELAAAGMKAIHPRALGPVRRASIVTWVRDIGAPDQLGTRIGASVVSGIAVVQNVPWLSLASEDMCDAPGFLARAAEIISKRGLDIGVTATGDVRISFTVAVGDREREFAAALEELRGFALLAVRPDSAVISVVAPSIGAQLLSEIGAALASAHIPLRGSSMAGSVDGNAVAPQSFHIVVAASNVFAAVKVLHAAFFEL